MDPRTPRASAVGVCQPESMEKAIWSERKVSDITGKEHTVFKLKRKNKITGELYSVLTPLSELVKLWEQQPVEQIEPTYCHCDMWEQMDMFEITESELLV